MIYFIMFQDSLFLFIKLKTIYKFKGSYNPLTQAIDNIMNKKIILIHNINYRHILLEIYFFKDSSFIFASNTRTNFCNSSSCNLSVFKYFKTGNAIFIASSS